MRAVARLVFSYFHSTPMTRACTYIGIALAVISLYPLTNLPQSEHMLAFAMLGQLALFLGSTWMPLIFGRLAQGQAARLLPGVRVKLLASAMLTVALVALPAGLLTPLAFAAGVGGSFADLSKNPQLLSYTIDLAWLTYTTVCIIAGWLYVVLWFLSSERNVAGVAKGLLIILFLMVVPASEIRELSAASGRNVAQLAVAWTVFGVLFLSWPRLKPWIARWLPWRRSNKASSGRAAGRETDLLLGTANPWPLVAALALQVAILSRLSDAPPTIWLLMLVIFSIVTGAVAGQAAERSRALWLRGGWSRAQMFVAIEQSFWRHNSVVLGILLVLMVTIGSYAGYPLRLMAVGLPLMVVGTALTTYLGLLLTKGLRWPESVLGIAIVGGLICIPLFLVDHVANSVIIAGIELLFAGVALALREFARRRWGRIDWTQCRPPRIWSARNA